MTRVDRARGDAELRCQPGIWAGKRRKPRNETEALAQWSPVALAWAIERGFVLHTPLQLTKAGAKWLKSRNRKTIDVESEVERAA